MRLTVILVIGAVLISATYAWMNSSQAQVDRNAAAQKSPAELSQLGVRKTQLVQSKITSTTVTTIPAPAAGPAQVIDNHATSLDAARIQARTTTGQNDPFSPLVPVSSEFKTTHTNINPAAILERSMIPPPPPTGSNPFGDSALPGQLNSGLNIGELPMPPEKAGLHPRLQLVGILGDRAIFNIKDNLLRRKHHWPKTFTLAVGQEFDGMRLSAVKDESVLVEEDGQTIEMPMPVLK